MDVITANPKTAGVARWNFFALWGARMDKGEAAALDYVTKVGDSSSSFARRGRTTGCLRVAHLTPCRHALL